MQGVHPSECVYLALYFRILTLCMSDSVYTRTTELVLVINCSSIGITQVCSFALWSWVHALPTTCSHKIVKATQFQLLFRCSACETAAAPPRRVRGLARLCRGPDLHRRVRLAPLSMHRPGFPVICTLLQHCVLVWNVCAHNLLNFATRVRAIS